MLAINTLTNSWCHTETLRNKCSFKYNTLVVVRPPSCTNTVTNVVLQGNFFSSKTWNTREGLYNKCMWSAQLFNGPTRICFSQICLLCDEVRRYCLIIYHVLLPSTRHTLGYLSCYYFIGHGDKLVLLSRAEDLRSAG